MMLRKDYRDERRKRFVWKAWQDILALLGTSIVVGFAVYTIFMMATEGAA